MTPDESKLRALAEFAAGAGHEINNPVATIVGHVQRLLKDEQDLERRQTLLTIGAQAYRIRDMIADVMLFARPPELRRTSLDLAEAASNVAEKLSTPERPLERQLTPGLVISADAIQVSVVLSELLRNAIQASSRESPVQIVVDQHAAEGVTWARLRVIDHGLGFTDLDREHLFDPFYSGRQAGRGLGFGLCKCWRIVTQHSGRIIADSTEGTTTLTTLWPLPPEAGQ